MVLSGMSTKALFNEAQCFDGDLLVLFDDPSTGSEI
jgi:hypothetical protein